MKVLVIGYVWPEPNSSAAGSHMLSILKAYRSVGWQVTFATPAQKTEHMVDLADYGIQSQEIALNCSSFDEFAKTLMPDVVMFDRFMMEEQFGWRIDAVCPNAIKVLDTEDLQSLRNARHTALKQNRPLCKADYHNPLALREIASILRSDLSLIISDHEMALLFEQYQLSPALLMHLPFMFDCNTLTNTKGFHERAHFMTIGNFRHAPNWDSVLYLQSIWPKIRAQLPNAELHIYGSYPPPKATALHNPKTGFMIKGWAEDAMAVIQNAKVMLSPLRFGAGIKGKFLDAMAQQTPSVTTQIGIEGMFNEAAWPGLVADKPDAIVNAAVSLYQDETLWQQKSDLCHSLVRQKFSAETLSKQLIERILSIKNTLEEHRLNNFYGAMLKHHNHASTKYMAQWIEAKNKAK